MDLLVLKDAQLAVIQPLCYGKRSAPGCSGKNNRMHLEGVYGLCARVARGAIFPLILGTGIRSIHASKINRTKGSSSSLKPSLMPLTWSICG